MVQPLGKLVDVEQHGAQHVEEALGLVAGAALHHHQQGAQDGGDRGVLVGDDPVRRMRCGDSFCHAITVPDRRATGLMQVKAGRG